MQTSALAPGTDPALRRLVKASVTATTTFTLLLNTSGDAPDGAPQDGPHRGCQLQLTHRATARADGEGPSRVRIDSLTLDHLDGTSAGTPPNWLSATVCLLGDGARALPAENLFANLVRKTPAIAAFVGARNCSLAPSEPSAGSPFGVRRRALAPGGSARLYLRAGAIFKQVPFGAASAGPDRHAAEPAEPAEPATPVPTPATAESPTATPTPKRTARLAPRTTRAMVAEAAAQAARSRGNDRRSG